ncbi:MAG: EpsG family protein [Bacilli bacterium]|nr:EpsG family protein [Bacilli bacterium]
MTIYIVLVIFSLCSAFADLFYLNNKTADEKNKIENLFLFIIAAVLILIATLRSDDVGIDTAAYHNWFQSYENKDFVDLKKNGFFDEPGFAFLNIAFNKMNLGWGAFKFFSVCIYVIPFLIILKKYSLHPLVNVLLFVLGGGYFFIFSTLRQGIGLGFIFIAFLLSKRKTIVLSLTFYLIAITVHSTCIVFILFYLAMLIALNNSKHLVIWLVCGLFAAVIGAILLRTSLLNYALTILHKEYKIDESTGGYLTLLFYLGMLFVFCVFTSKTDKKNFILNNGKILKLFLLTITFFPIVAFSPSVFRILMYFSFACDIFFVNACCYLKEKNTKIIVSAVFLAAYVYLFAFTMMIPSKGLNPYTIFNL